MKDNRNKQMPTSAIIAILVAIIIVVLTQYYNREFPLQYMENGEMKTEVFKSTKEFNQRAAELKADSVKYWLP